jgi:large subunit ribosomal protein L24
MVTVKEVNLVTRHIKPQRDGEAGKIVKEEAPIHHSKVMLYSKEKGVRSRVGSKVQDGKKVRYLVKTGEVLP